MRIQKTVDGPEIFGHDESSQRHAVPQMQHLTEDCKRVHLQPFLLALGMTVMPLNIAMAESNDWQEVRDDFLQGDPELLQFHCDRGEEANKKINLSLQ